MTPQVPPEVMDSGRANSATCQKSKVTFLNTYKLAQMHENSLL